MSENLNKEMEEVVEDTLEEETPAHKSVKGKGGVVAPVTTPENQQKDKSVPLNNKTTCCRSCLQRRNRSRRRDRRTRRVTSKTEIRNG